MLKTCMFLLFLFQLTIGGYQDDTEFDKAIEAIVKDKAGGDPTFLQKFVNDKGIPIGLGQRDGFDDSFCFNISQPIITSSKYSDCVIMESFNKTIVKLNAWSGFDVFKLSVNLLELKNIDLELNYQNELTYLYFTAFEKCDNCLFNFTKNPSLVGIRFWKLSHIADLSKIDSQFLPKLYIRGNRRLKLTAGDDRRKKEDLERVCNKKMCVIQENEECHFRHSIKKDSEYRNCRYVYGDMHFSDIFQNSNPAEMNFKLEGCFVFNRTGIQNVRPIMKANVNCSHQHIFEYNKYMCTDQLEVLKNRWGADIKSDGISVKCYQGECRGGFLSERVRNRYSGCEVFRGNIHITRESGNVSERIRELSYAHLINGSLHLSNNTYLTLLSLPFLKKIDSAICPAFLIENMTNLKDVIFNAHVVFQCNSTGPKVIVRNSPSIYLHHQLLRQMRTAGAVLEDFDSETDSYSEKVTLYLIGICFLIVIFVEIIWALRRNLLMPNFFYRLFPMSVHRKPKQKQSKKKKEE